MLSFVKEEYLQWGQVYGLEPVCIKMCRFIFPEYFETFEQNGHAY